MWLVIMLGLLKIMNKQDGLKNVLFTKRPKTNILNNMASRPPSLSDVNEQIGFHEMLRRQMQIQNPAQSQINIQVLTTLCTSSNSQKK